MKRIQPLKMEGELWPFNLIMVSNAPQSRCYFLILKRRWMSLILSRSLLMASWWMKNDFVSIESL